MCVYVDIHVHVERHEVLLSRHLSTLVEVPPPPFSHRPLARRVVFSVSRPSYFGTWVSRGFSPGFYVCRPLQGRDPFSEGGGDGECRTGDGTVPTVSKDPLVLIFGNIPCKIRVSGPQSW